MSSFLLQRTATIKTNEFVVPAFDLESGEPQGSVFGPTFYFLYINDTLTMFADGFTQSITIDKARRTGLCNRNLALITHKVEKKLYENEWKIKTNMNKFFVVPVSRRKTHEL